MENKNDLRETLRRLSLETGFEQKVLEKDYYLTKILHKIAEKQIENLVFKGGTCLNKCYLGFYRLSEDLDFVYNRDVSKFSATQVKKILSGLRKELFEILNILGLKTDEMLGKGWKMLTAKIPQKFIGLEISVWYISLIDDSKQQIKIEISFRRKLLNHTKENSIKHEFYNELNEPLLPENIQIKCIDLAENCAEKFRALVTRKIIAARDVYDIYYVIKNRKVCVNEELISLVLLKINESRHFTKKEFIEFIKKLPERISGSIEEELNAVIKSGEDINLKRMLGLIQHSFDKL